MSRALLLVLLLVSLGAEDAVPQRRPSLGISVDLTADPLSADAGLVVSAVRSGSNGERIGLRAGDRILRVDGAAVNAAEDLQAALATKQVGDRIALSIQRGETNAELSGALQLETGVRDLAARAEDLNRELTELRGGDPAAQPRYSLQELLVILRQIERDLPAAAAEFKRVYPTGRFKIGIHIDIDSHGETAGSAALPPEAEASEPAP